MGKESRNINLQYDRQMELSEFEHQLQRDEWTRQFNMENQYNSPVNQAKLMQEAGFNPAAIAASGNVSTPAPAASPSNITPFSYSAPQGMSSSSQLFEALASLNNSLSKTVGTGLDVEKQQKMIGVMFDSAFADLQGKRYGNAMSKLLLDLREKWGDSQEAAKYREILSHAALLDLQGQSEQAHKLLMSSMEELYKSQDKRINAELPYVVPQILTIMDYYSSHSALNRAKSAEAYSAAGMYQSQTEYNNALVQTENQLREGKITMQQLQIESMRIANTVGSSNMRTFVATEQDRLRALVSEYERQGFITETTRANMQQAITNANWSEVEKYLGAMSQALNTVTGVYNAGSMRIGSMSQMQRNQVQSEFNRILDSHWSPNEPKPIHGFGYNVNP